MPPVSLGAATNALQSWVKDQSTSSHTEFRKQISVNVDISLLEWLSFQINEEKMYFRDRKSTFEAAAVGFVAMKRGEKLNLEARRSIVELLKDKRMRVYGGHRFDECNDIKLSDTSWDDFDAYVYVLPAVEFIRHKNSETFLAVNLPHKENAEELLDILNNLSVLSIDIPSSKTSTMHLASSMENTTTFETWSEQMENVLKSIKDGDYAKIVLSRRKRFYFSDPGSEPDPIQILRALDEANNLSANGRDGSYLFCIQLNRNVAFLGNSPERLFHIKGSNLNTVAVAGTVRKGEATKLWSEKNVREHNIVIEHISEALSTLKATVKVGKTDVLQLPRLLHLSTPIEGKLHLSTNIEGKLDYHASVDVFDLLDCIHPTPAVCGMPIGKATSVLRRLENFDRGLFAGPFGWFSKEESEFCVAIRSALVRYKEVFAFAGCGIVEGSEIRAEWEETELKMSAFTDIFRQNNSNLSFNNFVPNGVVSFDPKKMETERNLNTLWGAAVIEELCRCGVDSFFIAPGSRSAPLTVGALRVKNAVVRIIHDERSAGFMAVGYARATKKAAAVITSSGTAVANLLPAVVEACNDGLPILLLTADRPYELRGIGANQTIIQPKIFGCYTNWEADIPCPSESISLRKLLSDVDQAVLMTGSHVLSDGVGAEAGPVHLNFMFRESLSPRFENWDREYLRNIPKFWKMTNDPITSCLSLSKYTPREGDIFKNIDSSIRGVIIVGGGPGSPERFEDRKHIVLLAEKLCWPVIADVTSGMRLDRESPNIIHYADLILGTKSKNFFIDVQSIVQFGERFVSKNIARWIQSCSKSEKFTHTIICNRKRRCDPWQTVTNRIFSSSTTFVSSWIEGQEKKCVHSKHESDLQEPVARRQELLALVDASAKIDLFLNERMNSATNSSVLEPFLARTVLGEIRFPSGLFLGNSMPIRDMDAFSGSNSVAINIYANRGASGIDGLISTSIGCAIGSNLPVTALIGDISSLHDMSSLHALRKEGICSPPVTIIIVNNSGGAIFSMLPIADYKNIFTPAFDTPHSIGFEKAAEMFGIEYRKIERLADLKTLFGTENKNHRIVEVIIGCSHEENADLHKGIRLEVSRLIHGIDTRLT